MTLWLEWFRCVALLRPACARKATFLWMSIALAGFSVRCCVPRYLRHASHALWNKNAQHHVPAVR